MTLSYASTHTGRDPFGRVVFERVFVPSGFVDRLRGLLGHPEPELRDAWWFAHCSCVHTIGMRFPIDVLHLSGDGEILTLFAAVPPLRVLACRRARQVVELRNGAIAALGLRAGQRLELCP